MKLKHLFYLVAVLGLWVLVIDKAFSADYYDTTIVSTTTNKATKHIAGELRIWDDINASTDGFRVAGGSITKVNTINHLQLPTGADVTELSTDGTLAGDSDTALPTEKAVKTYVDGLVVGSVSFSTLTVTNSAYLSTATGNVGIGTTSPGAKLDVNGTTNLSTMTVVGGSSATFTGPVKLDSTLELQSGTSINEFSTDGTMAGNSDNAAPTEQAVKTYADSVLTAGSPITATTIDASTVTVGYSVFAATISGNVGIGTTTPAGKLHIIDTSDQLIIDDSDSAADEKRWVVKADGGDFLVLTANDDHDAFGTVLEMKRTTTTVDSVNVPNGNVGIGTTSPAESLDINGGSIKIGLASAVDNDSPGLINISDDDVLYNGEYINHYGFGFHTMGGGVSAYHSGFFGANIFTAGALQFRIDSSGNTGIGTSASAPSERLHIGTGNILLDSSSEQGYKIRNASLANNPVFEFGRIITAGGVNFSRIVYNDDASSEYEIARFGHDGSLVSISTDTNAHFVAFKSTSDVNPIFRVNSSPSAQVELGAGAGSATDLFLRRESAGDLSIYTNSAEVIRVDTSGNVGISTTAPTHKLAVDGGIVATSSITASAFHGDGANITNLSADISDETNLAVTAPITLTDDTVGITVLQDIVAASGLTMSGDGNDTLPGPDGDITISIQPDGVTMQMMADTLTLDADLVIHASGDNRDVNIDTGTFFLDSGLDRVGISTQIPQATLDVGGDARFDSIMVATDVAREELHVVGDAAISGTSPFIELFTPSGSSGNMRMKLDTGGDFDLFGGVADPPTDQVATFDDVGAFFRFAMNDHDGLAIIDSYVGSASYGQGSGLRVQATGKSGTTDANAVYLYPQSDTEFALSFGGSSDGRKLHIARASDNGSTKYMTVLADGNVGINNTAPTAKLEVDGTVVVGTFTVTGTSSATFTGDVQFNQDLFRDGNMNFVATTSDGSDNTNVAIGGGGAIGTSRGGHIRVYGNEIGDGDVDAVAGEAGEVNLIAGTTQVNVSSNTINVNKPFTLWNRTAAQLQALAPEGTGELVFNTDAGKMFISTGTAAGAWAASDDYTQGP